jgi:diguanylate cyclase (GGDEF)-like protein
MKFKIRFRTQAIIIIFSLILALTLLLTVVIGRVSSTLVRENIGKSLAQTAYQMSDKLDYYMWSRIGEVKILNKLVDANNIKNVERNKRALNDFKNTFPDFSWIGITDDKGVVISATDGILVGQDISSRPVYKEARNKEFIGDVHDAVLLAKLLPNPTGEPMKFVDISTPIKDSDGKLVGVLAAHLSWKWADKIQQVIMEPLTDKEKVDIFVVSSKDNSILLGTKDMIGEKLSLDSLQQAKAKGYSWNLETWKDDKNYVTGFSYGKGYLDYKGLGWTVLVRQPVDVAYAQVRKLQLTIIVVGIIAAIIFATIGWFVSGRVVKPIKLLTEAAKKLTAGEKAEIPTNNRVKEMDILSISIRELVSSLSRSEINLEKMGHIAKVDNLTGLPNRTALESFIEQVMEDDKTNITFLYIDLDNFKPVNDTYGHPVGDKLLKEVAVRLKSGVKETDMVSRLGGDEFLIAIYTEEDQLEYSSKVARLISKSLREPFYIEGNKLNIGCSIGGTSWNLETQTSAQAIRCADEALYKAKKSGKNRIYFYSDDDYKLVVI